MGKFAITHARTQAVMPIFKAICFFRNTALRLKTIKATDIVYVSIRRYSSLAD